MRFFACTAAIIAAAIGSPALAVIAAENVGLTVSKRPSTEQAPNPEMQGLFEADQAIRNEIEQRGGWNAVKDDKVFLEKWRREDAVRIERTGELLASNSLQAGIDFYRAAFIFQHSEKPEDFLKAHHLAVIAISKGYEARWISAATLDRYLLGIGRQQIYGTQFLTDESGKYIKRATDQQIVSDAERAFLKVPALAEGW